MVYCEVNKTYTYCNMDSQISARQRLGKRVTTQTTIGETVMEYVNTWLRSKSNDEKLLNYTTEACINVCSFIRS
jgi:hypothetical protein